jgi:hypothetical protein
LLSLDRRSCEKENAGQGGRRFVLPMDVMA